jgi:hypothetical protein
MLYIQTRVVVVCRPAGGAPIDVVALDARVAAGWEVPALRLVGSIVAPIGASDGAAASAPVSMVVIGESERRRVGVLIVVAAALLVGEAVECADEGCSSAPVRV